MRAHGWHSHAHLKLTSRKNPPYLKVLEAVCMHGAGGEGELETLFNRMRTTMSLLNHTSDFSASQLAVGRSLRALGRNVLRAVNNVVATIIAQREHQAQLTVLRQLSDRELRDIGISRSDIGAGLAEAAKDRTRSQRLLSARA
jgi:uncharacterized protein YjiS (DUF1127 family)